MTTFARKPSSTNRAWLLLGHVALSAAVELAIHLACHAAPAAARTQAVAPPASLRSAGIDLAAMDPTIKPCQDFYRYANGNWLAHTAIPGTQPDWNSFSILAEHNLSVERALAEQAARNGNVASSSPAGKVGSFYRAADDEARIQAAGAKPLASKLSDIAAVGSVPELMQLIAGLQIAGIPAGWGFGISPDQKRSDQEIVNLAQGGISLPERGYYERADSQSQAIRAAFQAHITHVFMLLGEPPSQAAADAKTAYAVEDRLALASKTPDELRDVGGNYHPFTLPQLDALTPGVPWQSYFDAFSLSDPGTFDVGQPEFFAAAGKMLQGGVPLADWKTYLRWCVADSESSMLSKPFSDEYFNFYVTTLSGVKEQEPRWKRAVEATDASVGYDLGRLYVQRQFPPAARERALAMVQNLKSVLRGDLASLPWMGPDTRRQALAKLDAMTIKIGYPDHWRDYSKLDVTSPDYATNVMRAASFESHRQLALLGKPVDKSEWAMTPPTVNAYYDPSSNSINFPAGILQPPFFNAQADDAVNYGAIGMVISHEMTHGFDDQGRQFDAQGNQRDWWTAADAANFAARAKAIAAQYSAYKPTPGRHINGALTTGENIADIGGLKIAYLALEKSLIGKPRPLIDGFTPEQRFFIAFAQMWRDQARPVYAQMLLSVDVHSPDKYRVIGALADMPEFRQAFHCPPDSSAVPVSLW